MDDSSSSAADDNGSKYHNNCDGCNDIVETIIEYVTPQLAWDDQPETGPNMTTNGSRTATGMEANMMMTATVAMIDECAVVSSPLQQTSTRRPQSQQRRERKRIASPASPSTGQTNILSKLLADEIVGQGETLTATFVQTISPVESKALSRTMTSKTIVSPDTETSNPSQPNDAQRPSAIIVSVAPAARLSSSSTTTMTANMMNATDTHAGDMDMNHSVSESQSTTCVVFSAVATRVGGGGNGAMTALSVFRQTTALSKGDSIASNAETIGAHVVTHLTPSTKMMLDLQSDDFLEEKHPAVSLMMAKDSFICRICHNNNQVERYVDHCFHFLLVVRCFIHSLWFDQKWR